MFVVYAMCMTPPAVAGIWSVCRWWILRRRLTRAFLKGRERRLSGMLP